VYCSHLARSCLVPLYLFYSDTDYPNLYFLPQYETERILEEALNEEGGEVEYGVSLDDLNQENGLVTTTIKKSNDEKEIVTSAWVIGADGGRSKTRDLIEVKMNRLRSDLYFIIADVTFKGNPPLESHAPGKGGHVFTSRDGMVALLPLPGKNAYRLAGQAPDGMRSANEVTMDEDFFEKFLFDRSGKTFDVELGKWKTIFEITHGASESFRKGNVMLAGDASHVHSPISGQGMNLGMQDALNIIWKLAWAKRVIMDTTINKIEAEATVEMILSSYNSERHSLSQGLVDAVEFGTKTLATKNPILQGVRDFTIKMLLPSNRIKNDFRKIGQLELAYSPESSPIIFENEWKRKNAETPKLDLMKELPVHVGHKTFICEPGQRLPNIRLQDGSNLHSHIDGTHHTWVHLNNNSSITTITLTTTTTTNNIGSTKKSSSVHVIPAGNDTQVTVPLISSKTLTAQQVLLVRPDQFVAGVGETKQDLLKQLINSGMSEKAISMM
jgi:2-polyprenyl-6-methoxyphenol hydroxylase-like FAD-dependent oxidoreductase